LRKEAENAKCWEQSGKEALMYCIHVSPLKEAKGGLEEGEGCEWRGEDAVFCSQGVETDCCCIMSHTLVSEAQANGDI
jgi:hypothetical protein